MAGAKKGERRGGRKKGTPNKKALPLLRKAQELGCDPFEILLMFANGDWKGLGYKSATETRYNRQGDDFEVMVITSDQRLRAASDACQYLHPKRKAIDLTIDVDEDRPLADLTDEELDNM